MAVRDDFTAGEVLAAADLNDTFASKLPYSYGTATPSTSVDGFLWYDENDTPPTPKFWDGAAFQALTSGKILQVVSTTKTDTFSAAVTAGNTTAVTGLSASITPTSATSKVLILVSLNGSRDNSSSGFPQIGFQISRGGSSIGAGTTASNRVGIVSAFDINSSGNASYAPLFGQFLDSPATTSSTTYSVEVYARSTDTYYVNRTTADADNVTHPRTQSTITVMEVSA